MVTIRLLGPPAVEQDGQPSRPPRGRKAWALLCYLVLAQRPPSRRHLADLLFADAADPLGALRWTLAELRRVLGAPVFTGDPVDTALGPEITVDVREVLSDTTSDPALLGLGTDLLEGLNLAASVEFESWLLVERHRISAAVEARLRQAALAVLAAGRPGDAVPYAAGAVARNPLEEGNHELLVRALAMSGDRAGAERQVAICEDLLRREIGVAVSAALRDAVGASSASPSSLPLSGRAAAESQIEAGRAAIVAGAADAGVQCLRQAVAESARHGDAELRARALVALGGALVHGVRGRDEEGAVVLHEAIAQATRAGDRATAVAAHRELGFVEVMAGRRTTADTWLARAQNLAETDDEYAAILGVRGMNASDMGRYPAALGYLGESVERAARCGDRRQQAWSLSLVGRLHLLRGERSQAAAVLADSLRLVHDQRWMAFLPWPQAIRAELDLLAGDLATAADGFERSWTMASQLSDPCWEGMAARGLGMLYGQRGDHAAAIQWFDTGVTRCDRVPDRYQWVHGYVLDAAARAAIDQGEPARAKRLTAALGALAARCDMRELVVRAHVHRSRLGDRTALAAARMLAADIDNPALDAVLLSA